MKTESEVRPAYSSRKSERDYLIYHLFPPCPSKNKHLYFGLRKCQGGIYIAPRFCRWPI